MGSVAVPELIPASNADTGSAAEDPGLAGVVTPEVWQQVDSFQERWLALAEGQGDCLAVDPAVVSGLLTMDNRHQGDLGGEGGPLLWYEGSPTA